MSRDKKLIRQKRITIRYKTPSREPISAIVTQTQDELGNWLMPTILWQTGHDARIVESARYAEDMGKALIVAAYFADEYALKVKSDEFAQIENEVEVEEKEDFV
jgi:predicted metal-dependent hydrolase